MNKPLAMFTVSALALSLAGPISAADTDTIKRDTLENLQQTYADATFESFDDFLQQVQDKTDNDTLKSAIDRYRQDETLEGNDFINVYRLLGLYTRLHYGDEVVDLLSEMVAVKTGKQGDTPQHENPGIAEFGELVKSKAEDFGLEFNNVDNRIFEVTLPGSTDEAFGILTHSDTVPANPDDWVLDDGTQLDPFTTTLKDGKIYGRGTEDDKASIAASLYAMKAIEENDVPLKRSIRLMIETTEETGGEGFEYYKKQTDLPAYNIVLDSGYPAVIAEKGFGTIDTYFPMTEADGQGPVITKITGGLATNQIPSNSIATIESDDPKMLSQKLQAQGQAYADDNGGDFEVSTEVMDDTVTLTVKGQSAHSSRPQSGVNPVPRLAGLLANSDIDFQENQYTQAIHYIDDNYGLDFKGEKLGVGYDNDFMGPLTLTPTYLEEQDGKLRVAVNVRAPKGDQSVEELAQSIDDKLAAYAQQNDLDMDVDIEISDWMMRDPQGAWLQTLLNIFGDTTGQKAEPIASAGSTTAKLLPNAINFGPSMPGEEYTGHTANEFKKVDNLMLDIQMFTEMLARIGNQEQLD
ncbi:dipeptidase [Halomonas sp. PR-M31]|uniref:dipeptidase n=1 Tax=Halomonas sp. PR-M31 TaxID=1471202 RepID=UPI0006507878|nr:dipeptidase [Halomonas sp. PR-M31]